jgi:flagellar biosynthesis protein
VTKTPPKSKGESGSPAPTRHGAPSTPQDRQFAVALAYRQDDNAPKVVAKGRGVLAAEIIARAKEAGVFVHESPELVSLLMQVDLDQHIPPQLYRAVAELLAWLYRIENGIEAPAVP